MTATAANPFRPTLFSFLRDLEKNNRREWFETNKSRYEDHLKEPALAFISAIGPELAKISPHFNAIPTATGGSLFRIYRDTRFSKDKTPYKTHLGIQFRHKQAKDVHAPGFYLHVESGGTTESSMGGSMIGVGIWHPDGPSLRAIRDAIVADGRAWKRARDGKKFREIFALGGESLKRPPRGYPDDHPLVDDLKRKDFVGFSKLTQKEVLAADFVPLFVARCRASAPFVRWLCEAVGVPF